MLSEFRRRRNSTMDQGDESNMTKIDIFSGFLGAGKTTLIKKLLKESLAGEQVVLIENEFGEIGIDGGFMKEAGIQVTEMNSGCICCSLVGDFGEALRKVIDQYHPDRILIEPSGVGKLSDVIRAVEGVERIRLGSLEPRIMDEEFVKGLADIGKICPHFHLSLQSGSDTVLKRMNRHYTTADFTECADNLRKYFNDPALTTDVITGFPGETEEEFKETLAFAEKTGFYEMHIFRYSRREGTPAAAMKGQLSNAVKAKRSDALEALGKRLKADYINRFAGREQEVLFEEIKEDDKGIMRAEGYTSRYIRLSVPAGDLEGFKPGMTAYAAFDCTDGEEPVEAYVV